MPTFEEKFSTGLCDVVIDVLIVPETFRVAKIASLAVIVLMGGDILLFESKLASRPCTTELKLFNNCLNDRINSYRGFVCLIAVWTLLLLSCPCV